MIAAHRVQGCKVRCAKNHLIVSVYRAPQMQGFGRADVLLYFKCLADAVPCERLHVTVQRKGDDEHRH
jgi:hypothetical protein